jgi:hypothetical protein
MLPLGDEVKEHGRRMATDNFAVRVCKRVAAAIMGSLCCPYLGSDLGVKNVGIREHGANRVVVFWIMTPACDVVGYRQFGPPKVYVFAYHYTVSGPEERGHFKSRNDVSSFSVHVCREF